MPKKAAKKIEKILGRVAVGFSDKGVHIKTGKHGKHVHKEIVAGMKRHGATSKDVEVELEANQVMLRPKNVHGYTFLGKLLEELES